MSLKQSSLFTPKKQYYLFFDTETTGLPMHWNTPATDINNWPRIVQIAWQLHTDEGTEVTNRNYIIQPQGFTIPKESSDIHGITQDRAQTEGVPLQTVLQEFQEYIDKADFLVAHNISFDEKVVGAEFLRKDMLDTLPLKNKICTKEISTNFCAIPHSNGKSSYKWPKLSELYMKLFGEDFADSHNALADVHATAKCFFALKEQGIV